MREIQCPWFKMLNSNFMSYIKLSLISFIYFCVLSKRHFFIQAWFRQKSLLTQMLLWPGENEIILLSIVSKDLKVQIQPVKWLQLLRDALGEEQIHSAGIHWTSASSIFWRSALSSLNAMAISPLTITLSNRWPYWFSMVSAKSIMSSKSSSCKKKTLM